MCNGDTVLVVGPLLWSGAYVAGRPIRRHTGFPTCTELARLVVLTMYNLQ